jgi:hypothetical protein
LFKRATSLRASSNGHALDCSAALRTSSAQAIGDLGGCSRHNVLLFQARHTISAAAPTKQLLFASTILIGKPVPTFPDRAQNGLTEK